jgi:hypothetical protein
MPKTAKHLAGGVKAGKKFMIRLSGELLDRIRLAAELNGMEVSEYLRKAATDALNADTRFIENQGKTAYLGATPAQLEQFLRAPLGREEIYFGNQRRVNVDVSMKILADRLAALEKKLEAAKRPHTVKKESELTNPLDI